MQTAIAFCGGGKDSSLAPDRSKTCPSCGKQFHCRPAAGCWCGSLQLPHAVLEELERTYSGCLCPACLNRHAQAGAPAGPAEDTRL